MFQFRVPDVLSRRRARARESSAQPDVATLFEFDVNCKDIVDARMCLHSVAVYAWPWRSEDEVK